MFSKAEGGNNHDRAQIFVTTTTTKSSLIINDKAWKGQSHGEHSFTTINHDNVPLTQVVALLQRDPLLQAVTAWQNTATVTAKENPFNHNDNDDNFHATITTTNVTTVWAICKYRKWGQHWTELSVAWQQATRCLSFWQQVNRSTTTNMLRFGNGNHHNQRNLPIMKPLWFIGNQIPLLQQNAVGGGHLQQVVDLLRDVWGVEIVRSAEDLVQRIASSSSSSSSWNGTKSSEANHVSPRDNHHHDDRIIVARPLFVDKYQPYDLNPRGQPIVGQLHPWAGYRVTETKDAREWGRAVLLHRFPLTSSSRQTINHHVSTVQPTVTLWIDTSMTERYQHQLRQQSTPCIQKVFQRAFEKLQQQQQQLSREQVWQLEQQSFHPDDDDDHRNAMEQYGFLAQIPVFAKSNVILIPAGYDWTGISFLPPCAVVVEIFEKHRPIKDDTEQRYFHASLAATVNAKYISVRLGRQDALDNQYDHLVNDAMSLLNQQVKLWKDCMKNQREWQEDELFLSKSHDTDHRQASVDKNSALSFSVADGCLAISKKPRSIQTNYSVEYGLEDLVLELSVKDHWTSHVNTLSSSSSSFNANAKHAVCWFRPVNYWSHFPHAMQQLMRCFSFWQMHPEKSAVLVWDPELPSNLEFVWSIRRILQSQFGVQERQSPQITPTNSLVVQPLFTSGVAEDGKYHGIVFANQRHARLFRQETLAYLNLTTMSAEGGCKANKDRPMIGILDRRESSQRTLANLSRLVTELREQNFSIKVFYFEGLTFAEQIETLQHVDILLSPHGAQLTSLFFLPPCAAIIELFPPGYYVPHFFGPLAAVAGFPHVIIYTGADLQGEWYNNAVHSLSLRDHARSLDICVPLAATIQSIQQLSSRWQTCCAQT